MTEDTADGRSRPGTEGDQAAGRRPPRREPPLTAAGWYPDPGNPSGLRW